VKLTIHQVTNVGFFTSTSIVCITSHHHSVIGTTLVCVFTQVPIAKAKWLAMCFISKDLDLGPWPEFHLT